MTATTWQVSTSNSGPKPFLDPGVTSESNLAHPRGLDNKSPSRPPGSMSVKGHAPAGAQLPLSPARGALGPHSPGPGWGPGTAVISSM